MALVLGTNSYATLEEAEAYLADRLDVAAWSSASDTLKQQALVSATTLLDTINWTGVAVSASQALAFPRVGSYFSPKLGMAVIFDNTIPSVIKVATIETAYHLLNNDGILDDTGSADSIQVGPITIQKPQNASKLPSLVSAMIRPLRERAGSNAWWRAN